MPVYAPVYVCGTAHVCSSIPSFVTGRVCVCVCVLIQAERLESEIEACVFALEESWTEPATTHSHTHNTEHTVRVSGPQAGPSKVAALSSRRVSLGGGVAGGGQRRRTDDTGP